MRFRLGWRITASMLLVSLLPLAVLGISIRQQVTSSLQEAAQQQLTLQMDRAAGTIEAFIDANTQVLDSTAVLPSVTAMEPPQQVEVYKAVVTANPDFSNLHSTDVTGMDKARSDNAALVNFSERSWFTEPMQGAAHAYQTLIAKATGKPALVIGVPMRRGTQTVGVLAGVLSLDKVSEVVNGIQFGRTGRAWLVDDTDKIMAHPDAEQVTQRTDMSKDEAVVAARKGDNAVRTVTENEKSWLTVTRTLPEGWVLVLQMEESEALAQVNQFSQTFLKIGGGALLAVLLLALILSASLTRPVVAMASFVGQMAGGDFTGALKLRRNDELGDMANALRRMQENMREHVNAVQSASGGVVTTASNLSESAATASEAQNAIAEAFDTTLTAVRAGTREQQEKLESAKGSVGELVAAVEQIATSATSQAVEVNQAAQTVDEVVRQAKVVSHGVTEVTAAVDQVAGATTSGQSRVEEALRGIQATNTSVHQAAATVQQLGERSNAIGSILEEIAAIASQTNLLALNAAIEAARAGEAGRGFAVVADEVRKLADRSVRSAEEIGRILASVQEGVRQAVTAMEEGTVAAQDGAEKAGEVQIALNDIMTAVASSRQTARSIQTAVEGLVAGHGRLADTMQTLASVSEENSATAEEMAAGSETVRQTVEELDTLALQHFSAIEGVGAELEHISSSVTHMVSIVEQLEGVSQALTQSVNSLRV